MLGYFVFAVLFIVALQTPDPDLKRQRLGLLIVIALVALVMRLVR